MLHPAMPPPTMTAWASDGMSMTLMRSGCGSVTTAAPAASFLQVLHRGLRPRVDPELPKDALQMAVYRPGADPEPLSDFLVDVPFAQVPENLSLPGCQPRHRGDVSHRHLVEETLKIAPDAVSERAW